MSIDIETWITTILLEFTESNKFHFKEIIATMNWITEVIIYNLNQ